MNCKNCEYGLPWKNGDFGGINCTYEEGECVKILVLEAQIEKMKCCQNCKYFECCDSNHYYCSLYCGLECEYDKSYKNWEMKEK